MSPSAPRLVVAMVSLAAAVALAACGSSNNPPGSAGTGGSGGSTATGTGGTNGSGGTGGGTGSGGASTTGSGGATATGGAGGSAGTGGSGGSTATGAGGTGGAPRDGGAGGSGGAGAGGTGGAPRDGGADGPGGTTGSGTGGADGGVVAAPFKGLANGRSCAELTTLKLGWYYNWTTNPFNNCTAAAEFVPMVTRKEPTAITSATVTSAINGIASRGYKTVLGFNEPNKVDQSNLSVDTALSLWPALTANAGLRVSSPSTSADAPGQAWMTDFMTRAMAMGLRIDFVAIHWYGWNAGSCNATASQLESYIQWAERLPGNKPIWLTEWGCLNLSNPDRATVQAFYAGALAVFARHPRIERYAWYPWTLNNEVSETTGALTPLGTAMSNAPTTR